MLQQLIQKAAPSLTLAILIVGTTGCASDKQVLAQSSQFHSGLQPAVMTDPELDRYINDVGARIIRAAAEVDRERGGKTRDGKDDAWMFSDKMKFYLVNSKTLNAFTTGGEKMYIYNELLQSARSEDELAAVMAHEYAHVYGHHVQSGMNRQLALMLGAGALGAAGYAAGGKEKGAEYAQYGTGVGMLAGQLVNSGFSRESETEADSLGFDFYTRAGWDPARFGDFFKTMAQKVGSSQGPDWMSSHPTLASRVQAAEQRAQKLGPRAAQYRREPVADARRFQAIQERARRVGQSMPDDQSLENSKQLLQALPRSCLTPDQPVPPDARRAQQALAERAQDRQGRGADGGRRAPERGPRSSGRGRASLDRTAAGAAAMQAPRRGRTAAGGPRRGERRGFN